MGSRVRWFLGVLTLLAAGLTAATTAYAVDQTPKNGCTSPQAYSGSITSPAFQPASADVEFGAAIAFRGWFEIESIAPSGFDKMIVEYRDPAGSVPDFTPLSNGDLIDQSTPNTSSGSDIPYSNLGTSVPPGFQNYNFNLPTATTGHAGVQVRIRFDTGDTTFQGFRGLGIDTFSVETNLGLLTQNFDNGAPGWTLDGPSGPGGPFWQVLTNPQNVSIKSPEVNPTLVTLPDNGALPAADTGTGIAWFGNTDSGTFCGPDFASIPQPPDTVITDGPSDSSGDDNPTFSFTGTNAAFFQCSLDGGPPEFCTSPKQYTDLGNGQHTFTVAATDFSGNTDPTPATRTWTIRDATLADLPAPQQGVSVNVDEVAGTVRVGIPAGAAAAGASGRASQKGIRYIPLSEAEQIPVGSFLDTRKGTVRLQSAANKSGKRQSGKFLSGLFQVRQSKKRSARGLTDLVLKGSSFRSCRRASSGKKASASLSRRQIRRLRANARGRFRTSGSNSSATVRGTIWDVTDRCDGTLTHVKRGTVIVRDFRRKKNITLKAGKSYLARAKGS